MKRVLLMILVIGYACTVGFSADPAKPNTNPVKPNGYRVHDYKEPVPDVVTPGKINALPPSDAIVLFDGKDMGNFEHDNKDPKKPKWKVIDGNLTSTAKAGYIHTKDQFGSMQLHVEWKTPSTIKGTGQGRGNSGIFLMGIYEIQVLDSFENKTYADGQASAVYGQKPPEVNASRKPGQWQTYDIIFHRPIFNANGTIKKKGTVTVIHNGVLVQDHWTILGTTNHKQLAKYKRHGEKGPLKIQDHGNPVQFRNIWLRELAD